jgi:hypothetical protein
MVGKLHRLAFGLRLSGRHGLVTGLRTGTLFVSGLDLLNAGSLDLG